MALIEGQPPKAAGPKEIGHQAAKASGWGRLSREGRCSGQRKKVSNVPGLGEDENLQDLDSLLEGLQPLCPPGLESSFHPREDTVPRELDSVGEDWRDGESKDFTEVEARIHWRGQSWRPAQEPRPMMVVLRFLLRRAPEAASKSLQARSTLMMSWRSSPRTWTSSMSLSMSGLGRWGSPGEAGVC